MAINKYIGSRYVPLYIGVHDENKSYEPLSIVSNEAKTKTYTSKQAVPVGVSIDNEDYWAQSGYFQDGIVDIHPDIYEVASYDQPTFTVTKGEEEAELKLEVADSYSAGDSFGEAYVLNTLTQAGLYIIKPSACVEVPEAIAEVETPVSLSVILYNVDSNPCYMQQIVSDNAIYVRHCDSETVWGDWQEISGGGGSYTLPVATANKLGGVKIGTGINVTSDGIISVNGGSGTSVWEDISSNIKNVLNMTIKSAYKNSATNQCIVTFSPASATAITVNERASLGWYFSYYGQFLETAKSNEICAIPLVYSTNATNGIAIIYAEYEYNDGTGYTTFRATKATALLNDITINTTSEMVVYFTLK